jgi:plasmid stability protein
MSQVLVREVEPVVIEKLKQRAQLHGRSLEAELRLILRQAAGVDMEAALQELRRIQADFAGRIFADSTPLVREDRER